MSVGKVWLVWLEPHSACTNVCTSNEWVSICPFSENVQILKAAGSYLKYKLLVSG